ncbi:MAG: FAD-dependent oxidoreductase [bacterium]
MKVAVLGGGFAGISAGFYISKKGHRVTLFEQETVLGGLATGFKQHNWDWYLERTVHHWFTNDNNIFSFAKDIGFKKISIKSPITASLYLSNTNNYRIIPLDNPQDFLKFPYLNIWQKFKTALILIFLKITPNFFLLEKVTAEDFLKKSMGKKAWEIMWKEMFRKKFGKYAGNILASFIWARINKRTKKLAYPVGGFQSIIKLSEDKLSLLNVNVKKGTRVEKINKKNAKVFIYTSNKEIEEFDAVVSTLPTPILIKISKEIFPKKYLKKLSKIKHNHAISLILELKKPFLGKTFWVNNTDPNNPIMGIFEHTNFIDKKHYGGNHLLYVGNYVDFENPLIKMSNKEVFRWYFKYLKKINPNIKKGDILNHFVFKGLYAQPIFDKSFLKNKPDFKTPIKNFYIANLDMTYPYDRGTNYAVKLGKKVASFF